MGLFFPFAPSTDTVTEVTMADDWADEPLPEAAPTMTKMAVVSDAPDIKLFNRWSCTDINVSDLSLKDYIAVSGRFLPHSAGRYASKRFRKAQCPIVERLVNSLMMHGRNNGKKLLTVRIVKHCFEIIHLLTGNTQSRFWLMPSSTPDLVRTPPVLDVPGLCVVRPSMSVLSGELTRPSGCAAPGPVRQHSVTSSLSPSVWLTS